MTISLTSILTQLHALPWTFNPPAAAAELDRLAATLACTLDDTLLDIYCDHNGSQPHYDNMFMMRLMPVEEVIKTCHMLSKFEPEFNAWFPDEPFPSDVRFFWSADDSSYAGLYVSGLLAGKVCFYNHDEPDFAPRFRSVISFYDHNLRSFAAITDVETAPAFYDMISDYQHMSAAPETDAADFKLALEFIAKYQAITDREFESRSERLFLGITAMNLLPFAQSDKLMPFLNAVDEDDMWLQAYACELLGKRRYTPAIPVLKEIALNGTHNGKLDAVRALGWMRTPAAKATLLEIQPQLTAGWEKTIEWALRDVDEN